jgi:hypothetical protein
VSRLKAALVFLGAFTVKRLDVRKNHINAISVALSVCISLRYFFSSVLVLMLLEWQKYSKLKTQNSKFKTQDSIFNVLCIHGIFGAFIY